MEHDQRRGDPEARAGRGWHEQRGLVLALLRLRAQLPGLAVRPLRRVRQGGLRLPAGEKHGPYYVLSNRSGGRGLVRLPRRRERGARRATLRQRATASSGAGCRGCGRSTVELVALLRRYQEAQLRRSRRESWECRRPAHIEPDLSQHVRLDRFRHG